MGELLTRWALVIGFGLLGAVTAFAAVMIVVMEQPGNVVVLSVVAVASAAIAFYIWRTIKRNS